MPSNKLLSRKITEIDMITTKKAFPTPCGAAVLKECILGPFTGFTLSTVIKQP
jgi:hypothetical protein